MIASCTGVFESVFALASALVFWGRYDDGVEQRTRWGVAKW